MSVEMGISQKSSGTRSGSWTRSVDRTVRRWLPALLIVLAILALWEAYVRIFDVQTWLLARAFRDCRCAGPGCRTPLVSHAGDAD